jgi:hypothetical protein
LEGLHLSFPTVDKARRKELAVARTRLEKNKS